MIFLRLSVLSDQDTQPLNVGLLLEGLFATWMSVHIIIYAGYH